MYAFKAVTWYAKHRDNTKDYTVIACHCEALGFYAMITLYGKRGNTHQGQYTACASLSELSTACEKITAQKRKKDYDFNGPLLHKTRLVRPSGPAIKQWIVKEVAPRELIPGGIPIVSAAVQSTLEVELGVLATLVEKSGKTKPNATKPQPKRDEFADYDADAWGTF